MTSSLRAVFLDRDGTLNEEKDYLHRIEDFAFIPGSAEAVRRLRAAGFLVVVATNQSGVARGYFPLEDVARLHDHLQEELRRIGTEIDAFYVCPHHPSEGVGDYRFDCNCRKGAPGMLLQAARDHGVDLPRSYMIGDKPADVEAGRAAGCTALLVRTGYGRREESGVAVRFPGTPVFDDLASAVDYILASSGPDISNA